jgi:GntR family histidine utilization transcriptional repressor
MKKFMLCKRKVDLNGGFHSAKGIGNETSRKPEAPNWRKTIRAPLYAGVKQMILDRIHSGEWPPKYRVPSENELVAELGVSKMTANRALRELASEGELVRIQGVGSFVAERKGYSALFEVRNIAEEIAERGIRT